MIAYLARPIDLVRSQENVSIIAGVVDSELCAAGITVYRPHLAFNVGHEAKPNASISIVNEAALKLADVVVVLFPEEKTIGTVLELAQAVQSGKPTVVLTAALAFSWSLAGLEEYENVYLTDEWNDAAVEWLVEMHKARPNDVEQLDVMRYTFLDDTSMVRDFSPQRQYSGDAGFDLYVAEDTEIPVGKFADVPCGIAVQLPPNTWGLVIGRSSTLRKHNLTVMPGVIDNGYRGPLYAGVYNQNGHQFSAKQGMRLAQFIPFPLTAAGIDPQWVEKLETSDRGTAGFGSTGE